MPRRLATAAAIALALAAGACSSPRERPTPLPAATTPMPSQGAMPGGQPLGNTGGTCNAAAASFLVGELGTTASADQAQQATGAESVRILFPNQPITKEFIAGRLNLETDDANRITSVRCG
ncbi:MAG: proteinase inhibitor I78 [Fulvimarina sp.]|nr:proteinase inhibitor I78 [Fulvimarina sp.]